MAIVSLTPSMTAMKNIKLSKLWDSLHSSYWFLPTIIAAISFGLAIALLSLDRRGYYQPLLKLGLVYTGGPDGARAMLSAIASSTITVATTAFSITIVALQLASSQFGPRLLRNFMQDTGNQIVLGTFIGTFIYCLLVLRTVRGEDYNIFVPQLSVTFAIGLAIASIGVLIYFIHHASTIIQASHVIKSVSRELENAIDRLFPEKIGRSIPNGKRQVGDLASFDAEACLVKAVSSGYLQAIDDENLMQIAGDRDLLLRLKYYPGQFIIKGSALVMVCPQERVDRKVAQQLNDAFILGNERNEQQDIEFPINQLVEIALRAISPGINDPFTAIRCIDQLSAGLSLLVQRNFPSPYRYDRSNNLRIIARAVTFADLTDAAFNQIRQYSTKDVAVTIRLLEAIARIATYTNDRKQQEALLHHAHKIFQGSQQEVLAADKKDIEQRYIAAVQLLE